MRSLCSFYLQEISKAPEQLYLLTIIRRRFNLSDSLFVTRKAVVNRIRKSFKRGKEIEKDVLRLVTSVE